MLTLKQDVSWDGLAPEGQMIRAAWEQIATELGLALVVTCVCDGHGPEDPHTHGYAIDVRTAGQPLATVAMMAARAAEILGLKFYMQFETDAATLMAIEAAGMKQLGVIAHVNPASTGPHIHTQFRKGLWQAALAARSQSHA